MVFHMFVLSLEQDLHPTSGPVGRRRRHRQALYRTSFSPNNNSATLYPRRDFEHQIDQPLPLYSSPWRKSSTIGHSYLSIND